LLQLRVSGISRVECRRYSVSANIKVAIFREQHSYAAYSRNPKVHVFTVFIITRRGPFPEPSESIPNIHTLFKIHFNIIPPFTPS
jgi:hypothetical protein